MSQQPDYRHAKEVGIKRLIDSYEKTNRTVADTNKRKELEKFVTEKVMPQTGKK